MSTIRLKEQGSTPPDAAAGQIQMYAKTDGKLYTKQGGNSEQNLAVGGDISGLSLGKVLQMVTATPTGQTSVNTSTWTTTDLKKDITPISDTSSILITVNGHTYHPHDDASTVVRLVSGGATESWSEMSESNSGHMTRAYQRMDRYATGYVGGQVAMQFVHPHSGGKQTYALQMHNNSSGYNVVFPAPSDSNARITLMEIAG